MNRSLEPVVGETVYRVLCAMLADLSTSSSNKRLAASVAAMLQFAAGAAWKRFGNHPEEGSVAASLFAAEDWGDHEKTVADLADVVTQLFQDAGAPTTRMGTRYRGYRRGSTEDLVARSIVEYMHWHGEPYEHWE